MVNQTQAKIPSQNYNRNCYQGQSLNYNQNLNNNQNQNCNQNLDGNQNQNCNQSQNLNQNQANEKRRRLSLSRFQWCQFIKLNHLGAFLYVAFVIFIFSFQAKAEISLADLNISGRTEIFKNESLQVYEFSQNTFLFLQNEDSNSSQVIVEKDFYQSKVQTIQRFEHEISLQKIQNQLYGKSIDFFRYHFEKDLGQNQKLTIQIVSSDLQKLKNKQSDVFHFFSEMNNKRIPASVNTDQNLKSKLGLMVCDNGLFQRQIRSLLQQSDDLLKASCEAYVGQTTVQAGGNLFLGCLKGAGSLVKDVAQIAYELFNFLYKSQFSDKYKNQMADNVGDFVQMAVTHPQEFLTQIYEQIKKAVVKEVGDLKNCGPEFQARFTCKVILAILSGAMFIKASAGAVVVGTEAENLATWGLQRATRSTAKSGWDEAFELSLRKKYHSVDQVQGFKNIQIQLKKDLEFLNSEKYQQMVSLRYKNYKSTYVDKIKSPTIRQTTNAVFDKLTNGPELAKYLEQLSREAAQEMFSAKDIRKLQMLEKGEIESWAYAKVLTKRAQARGDTRFSTLDSFDLGQFRGALAKGPFIDKLNKGEFHGDLTHLLQQDFVSDVVQINMRGHSREFYRYLSEEPSFEIWDSLFDATNIDGFGVSAVSSDWVNSNIMIKALKIKPRGLKSAAETPK